MPDNRPQTRTNCGVDNNGKIRGIAVDSAGRQLMVITNTTAPASIVSADLASVDAHANAVSARVVSVSAELASLLASVEHRLSTRIDTASGSGGGGGGSVTSTEVSAGDAAVSAQAASAKNVVSARVVSVSAELASLVQIASAAATSADAHANTASAAATSADAHANTVSARVVSVSAELASLVQIASAAATSVNSRLDNVSAKSAATTVKGLQSVINQLSNRMSGITGGTGSVTSTELSAVKHLAWNTQTDVDYVLTLGDDGNIVRMNSSAAHVLTIPLNATVAFPIGTQILVEQAGTAAVSIAVSSGVTLEGTPVSTPGQYGVVALMKRDTDTWLLGNANANTVSARVVSVSAELASLVQIASAAATSADAHAAARSEEHTSELQSLRHLVCRLLLEKKNKNK